MSPFSWSEIPRAFVLVLERVAQALVLMALITALATLMVRLEERKHGATELSAATEQLEDCEAWASMNAEQKQRNYQADPERWDTCLCEDENCEVD